jgi:hypothetical protein
MLFGLTIAFMFAMIGHVSRVGRRGRRRSQ